jgi:hypothetical protein
MEPSSSHGRVFPHGPLRGRPSPPPGLSLVPRDGGRPLPQLRGRGGEGRLTALRMGWRERRAPPIPGPSPTNVGEGRTALQPSEAQSNSPLPPCSLRGKGPGDGGRCPAAECPSKRSALSATPTSPRGFGGRWASGARPEGACLLAWKAAEARSNSPPLPRSGGGGPCGRSAMLVGALSTESAGVRATGARRRGGGCRAAGCRAPARSPAARRPGRTASRSPGSRRG